MKIVGHSSGITDKQSAAARQRKYWSKRGQTSHSNADRGTKGFIGVDGEGINLPNGEHRYVLFGVGNDQIVNKDGIEWNDVLALIYKHRRNGFAFVGFYLSYDFDRWIRTMPYNRAYKLVTSEGRASRRSKSAKQHGKVLPVDMPHGWQINMLGKKMFEFRKRSCNCDLYYCEHPKGPFVRVCDAGPFFQSSFLKAIDPGKWPAPIVTMAEYELIKTGKSGRGDIVDIDNEEEYNKWLEDTKIYNQLENIVLARLMNVLNDSFKKMGIILAPSQWFGPGQAAQKWMKNNKIPKNDAVYKAVPKAFSEAARMSYFGGWFEIMMHGIIPGKTHEYDINSAYPYIISSLPCLLHGEWRYGDNTDVPDTEYVLVYAYVSQFRDHAYDAIGTMLHRETSSKINRPDCTKGWFWLSEINAAKRAGTIRHCYIYEWMSFTAKCSHKPLQGVTALYDLRLKEGSKSPLGRGCKLAYNSMYGKFAQSIGNPIYANPVYASLITSGCRTMILDAIATHPIGQKDVCMVATDAVFFVTPHPGLPISERLGDWDYKCRNNLTLFKPGVYWDDDTRKDIRESRIPIFKARGIAAADFASCIDQIDRDFREWDTVPPEISIADQDGGIKGWPYVAFEAGFAMTSCLQAIRRNDWKTAGEVRTDVILFQNSNPAIKRVGPMPALLADGRKVWRSMPVPQDPNNCESMPYIRRFGMEDPWSDEYMEDRGIHPDMPLGDIHKDSLGL